MCMTAKDYKDFTEPHGLVCPTMKKSQACVVKIACLLCHLCVMKHSLVYA